jgi:hypothetical protein
MPATVINPASLIGSYPTLPIAAGGADIAFTAADVTNGNQTPLTNSKTVIIAYNTDTVAHHVTISSVADSLSRTGDITSYSVAADKVSAFGPFQTTGWANSGNLLFSADSALIGFAVINLP